jgi:hypothetical protein
VRGLSRARLGRAAWWLGALLAIGVPMLVQRHWLRETYFVADDFSNFALAHLAGFGWDLLTANYNPWTTAGVHLAPGHRVLDWLVTVPAGNRYGAAILAMVASIGGTLAFTLGMLDDLLGRRPWHLLVVFMLGLAFPLLITASWFAAGAHALPGLCFTAGSLWGYARWRRSHSRWALAATWLSMAIALTFSPQPVLTVLYAVLLAVLVAPERLTPRTMLASLRADWLPLAGLAVIGGAYFLHEMIRSSAPAQGRTARAFFDLLEAVARDALPNVTGLALPSRLWVTAVLAVLGAALLSALGRRGLSALVFFAVVLVANVAVTWFGRSDIGLAAATEARYLTSLTLGFWIAVALALAPAARGPWRRLPDLRGRLSPAAATALAAIAFALVSAAAAKHYLGRLEAGFHGSGYTLQTSAAAKGLAYRLDRDLDRLDRSGDLPGLVNGEVPFPLYYANHPINQIGYLGHAFNDHVAAEGRGPRLFALTPDAEVKPAVFTAAGAATTRTCDGRCELVLSPRDPKAASPCFVRLRLDSGARVTATTFTLARALMKQGAPAGADPSGKPLKRWDIGPVTLDAKRPDATLMTWALDAYQVHVQLRATGRFAVTAQLGTVRTSTASG